tara:strand:+ start:694 stop:912 length:219 start_codon:yes stop_codon:yes gene_type:complete
MITSPKEAALLPQGNYRIRPAAVQPLFLKFLWPFESAFTVSSFFLSGRKPAPLLGPTLDSSGFAKLIKTDMR